MFRRIILNGQECNSDSLGGTLDGLEDAPECLNDAKWLSLSGNTFLTFSYGGGIKAPYLWTDSESEETCGHANFQIYPVSH